MKLKILGKLDFNTGIITDKNGKILNPPKEKLDIKKMKKEIKEAKERRREWLSIIHI